MSDAYIFADATCGGVLRKYRSPTENRPPGCRERTKPDYGQWSEARWPDDRHVERLPATRRVGVPQWHCPDRFWVTSGGKPEQSVPLTHAASLSGSGCCRATLRIRVGDQGRLVGVVVPSAFSRSATACSVEPALLLARMRLAMAGWSWRGRPSFTPAALRTARSSGVRVPIIFRSHSATDAVTLASSPPVGVNAAVVDHSVRAQNWTHGVAGPHSRRGWPAC